MRKLVTILLALSLLLMLSGCITVDIHQTLKPGGDYDMEIKFIMPEMLMQSMQEDGGMEDMSESIDPAVRDKFSFAMAEDGFTWKFTDLNFNEDVKLFTEAGDNETGAGMDTEQMNFMDPKTYEYVEDGSTAKYTIRVPAEEVPEGDGMDAMGAQMLSQMFTVTYSVETFGKIIDTNGEIDEENNRLVVFTIDLAKGGDYYVEFKTGTSFMDTIMDNLMWVLIGIGIVIVLIVVFILMHGNKAPPANFSAPAGQTPVQPAQQSQPQQPFQPAQPQQPKRPVQPAQPAQPSQSQHSRGQTPPGV